jgi:hypothetical protein
MSYMSKNEARPMRRTRSSPIPETETEARAGVVEVIDQSNPSLKAIHESNLSMQLPSWACRFPPA